MMRILLTLLALMLLVAGSPLVARAGGICADAARHAARHTGVPQEVLLAITRVETGRRQGARIVPWPWTINDSGTGSWYASRSAAEDAAAQIIAAGRASFDIGCFQLNYRWHAHAFRSLSAMFDPEDNALYAARFLRDLHEESGDWSVAAGAYHSRTPEHASRYRTRFDAALAAVGDEVGNPPGFGLNRRVNTFPLLQSGGGDGIAGSLVPLGL